jgi:hypothetical protein
MKLKKGKLITFPDFVAIVFKIIITIMIVMEFNLHFNRSEFFACSFILYPIISLVFDLILNLSKDKIWIALPPLLVGKSLGFPLDEEDIIMMAEKISEDSDVTVPGSLAWFTRQHLDLM